MHDYNSIIPVATEKSAKANTSSSGGRSKKNRRAKKIKQNETDRESLIEDFLPPENDLEDDEVLGLSSNDNN